MCICYLDCDEAGLFCYLVIQIETLLHPLQLFYFHLWLTYWLSLICSYDKSMHVHVIKKESFLFNRLSLMLKL
jgi:hypothetical protein